MNHVLLLGDSIFDNAAYAHGGPAVIDHLRNLLPDGWKCTLLAEDGTATWQVPMQLEQVPEDASHLIVSAGGNNVLMQAGILAQPAASVGEALDHIADLAERFEESYVAMVRAILKHSKPLVLSTIYFPSIPEPELQRRAVALLSTYNDCIIRTAVSVGVPLLDLRLICNEPSDYANRIEPSASGGAKIADAIARFVLQTDSAKQTRVAI